MLAWRVALALLTYVNLVAALLASRMAFDAYGSTDMFALGIFALALVLAYVLGGFSNFFLRRPFVSDAVFGMILMVTLAFVVINFFDKEGQTAAVRDRGRLAVIPAAVLILFALWILAGLALACSTRFEMIPTLAICSAFFCLGSCRITCLAGQLRTRFLVGIGALHRHAKLAAFLAR